MEWTTLFTPGIGATGLLAAVVFMVLTGRLQPKTAVDDRIADKDRQIETWHAAYEQSLEIQREQQRQISALVEASETATRVIAAIPRAAGMSAGTEGGGP